MTPRRLRRAESTVNVVLDEEVLTQYGRQHSAPMFRSGPRDPQDGGELSLLRGWLSESEAGLWVARRSSPLDAARRTLAGSLRYRGFIVVGSPTAAIPIHVSVIWPGRPARWHPEWQMRFEAAFTDFEGGGQDADTG